MQIKDQVVSLELAKKLKELGVKQGESLFHWLSRPWGKEPFLYKFDEPGDAKKDDKDCWSAFTVAELGEMLPCGVYSYKLGSGFRALADGELWSREGGVTLDGRPFFDAEHEADARAKMLIYLIEKGMVKP